MPISKCNCNHQFQDERYGKGLRVFNLMAKSSKSTTQNMRCTVCGSIKGFTSETVEEKKKK